MNPDLPFVLPPYERVWRTDFFYDLVILDNHSLISSAATLEDFCNSLYLDAYNSISMWCDLFNNVYFNEEFICRLNVIYRYFVINKRPKKFVFQGITVIDNHEFARFPDITLDFIQTQKVSCLSHYLKFKEYREGPFDIIIRSIPTTSENYLLAHE